MKNLNPLYENQKVSLVTRTASDYLTPVRTAFISNKGLKKLKSASLAKRGKVQGISGTWHTPEAIKNENDKVKATKDSFKRARKAEAKYNAEWRRS